MPYFPPSQKHINLTALNQSEGNLILSDGYWGVSIAIIEHINITTSALDWDLWIFETNDFNLSDPTTKQIVDSGIGSALVDFNSSYNSDSTSVYLRYIDNIGSNTASFYITGRTVA